MDERSDLAYYIADLLLLGRNVREINESLKRIATVIEQQSGRPVRPGPPALKVTDELPPLEGTTMARYKFDVGLEAPVVQVDPPVRRHLTTLLPDGSTVETTINDVTIFNVTSPAFIGPFDGEVTNTLTDYDARGNASAPNTITERIPDTIGPATPGPFGIKVTEEVE